VNGREGFAAAWLGRFFALSITQRVLRQHEKYRQRQ